jgi:hypothetical protein
MITNRMKITAMATAMIVIGGTANAGASKSYSCPAAAEMEWTIAYTTDANNGDKWIGENPRWRKYIKNIAFSEAYIHNSKGFVSRDYMDGKGRYENDFQNLPSSRTLPASLGTSRSNQMALCCLGNLQRRLAKKWLWNSYP